MSGLSPGSSGKRSPAAAQRRPKHETPKPRPVRSKPNLPKVQIEDVILIPVVGTPGKGKGPEGEKWRIEVAGKRAGEVYINVIDEPPVGRHASIQIHLNIKSQGRGIGRVGYLKACQSSRHQTIYAHMRKSNLASRRAAEAAGFVDATPPGYSQLILVQLRTPAAPVAKRITATRACKSSGESVA